MLLFSPPPPFIVWNTSENECEQSIRLHSAAASSWYSAAKILKAGSLIQSSSEMEGEKKYLKKARELAVNALLLICCIKTDWLKNHTMGWKQQSFRLCRLMESRAQRGRVTKTGILWKRWYRFWGCFSHLSLHFNFYSKTSSHGLG